MPESDTLTIRIPKDIKKQIKKAAKEDDRSVTSFVVHAVRLQLDALAGKSGAK